MRLTVALQLVRPMLQPGGSACTLAYVSSGYKQDSVREKKLEQTRQGPKRRSA